MLRGIMKRRGKKKGGGRRKEAGGRRREERGARREVRVGGGRREGGGKKEKNHTKKLSFLKWLRTCSYLIHNNREKAIQKEELQRLSTIKISKNNRMFMT